MARLLSRRTFLSGATCAVAGVGLLAAACQPAPTAAPPAAPAKPTEAPKPTAAASPVAATSPAASPAASPAPSPSPAAKPAGQAPAAKGPLSKLATGIVAAIDQLGTPVAKDRGFFEQSGLDVEILQPFPTGVDAVNAVQNNSAQVIQIAGPIFGAGCSGLDIVCVGTFNGSAVKPGSDDNLALVARQGSGIERGKVESLRGKRIAASQGTINYQYLVFWLQRVGLSPSDVTVVNTPPPEFNVALQTGAADAITGWDPWPILATKNVPGAYEIVRGGEVLGYYGFQVALRDWMTRNEDLLDRFLQARAASDQWMRKNPEETARIAVRWLPGMTEDVALESMKYEVKQLDIRLSRFSYKALDDAQELLFDARAIRCKLDINKHFEPKYIQKVERENPALFDDLPPVPEPARVGPGFVYQRA